MKKKLYQTGMIGIILAFGIIVMGCGTTKLGAYGTTLQTAEQEQLSHLNIHRTIGITGFNGKPVQWGIAQQTKHTNISIPAGQHSFRFDYHSQSNAETPTDLAWNYVFTYEYLAGHSYSITAGVGGRRVIVFVDDKTDKTLSRRISLQ